MWEPRTLVTLWPSTACNRDIFTFTFTETYERWQARTKLFNLNVIYVYAVTEEMGHSDRYCKQNHAFHYAL
jgi:hypothetical protein